MRRRSKDSFQCLNRSDYVDPAAEEAMQLRDVREQLGTDKTRKMFVTGQSFWGVTLTSLWSGLQTSRSTHHCAYFDLVPFDGSFQKQVIRNNHGIEQVGQPPGMVASPVWACSTKAEKEAIKHNLAMTVRRYLSELVDSQVIKYTRLACLPREPPNLATIPTLDVSKFQHNKPLPDEGAVPS